MSSTIPITKEFLEKILKKKVINFKVSSGTKPGDNYLSVLLSLEVQVAEEKDPLHLLFKTYPSHLTRQAFLKRGNIFLKEYQIFDVWIPELIKLQKNVIGNDTLLVPSMPTVVAGAAIDYAKGDVNDWKDVDPMLNNFILMVDARKTHNYKMANKLTSLGYQHIKTAFEELAKYQALGHAYKTHNKMTSFVSKFPFMEDAFYTNPDRRTDVMAFMKVSWQEVFSTCKDFLAAKPEIARSINKFKDVDVGTDYLAVYMDPRGMDEEKVESFMRIKPKEYSGAPLAEQWIVPLHADCWTNNILFKEDANGSVTSALLLDLQLACEGCITTDIINLLYTSTDTEFRKQHLDEMITWYYERFLHFCAILKTPPFPGFTLDNFKRKIHRAKLFGLLVAVLLLPMVLHKEESSVNLDDIEITPNGNENDGVEDFAEMFQKQESDEDDSKLLRDRCTELLSELYDEGVL